MNTNVTVEPELTSDASLVELSLAGDRDAFGRIVARYQSSICALAYSACGNVARSEDLAQEVFLAAWRELGTLREPGRFKAWLYGIARNLIHNAFRQHTRNPVTSADWLDETADPAAAAAEPDEQAISKEEETILWHVLSGLPQVYREPMVLFYRQNESIPEVAEVMGISEDAVRQRLSRGRALLNDRVAKVVQNGLRRSGPADTFTMAVIASLPVLAAVTTTKGAIVGMAATKSSSGQAAGLVGLLKGVGILGGLIALPAALGTYFGHRLSKDAGGLPQQRISVTRFWRFFGLGIASFLFLPLLLTFGVTGFLHGDARAQFLSIMTVWLGLAYPLVLVAFLFWAWQRRRPARLIPAAAVLPADAVTQPLVDIPVHPLKRTLRRWLLFLTIGAAGLLVFCLTDTHYKVSHLTGVELRDVINQTPPGELKLSIMTGHEHSMFHEYPSMYRYFWVQVTRDGKVSWYTANVDEATTALIAQKGLACPTYVAGRDYEILGTPGRMLPVLAAFVLAIGSIFLLKRRLAARGVARQSA